MIKKVIQSMFHALGYQINKHSTLPVIETEDYYAFSMSNALKRCKERGIEIHTVIDVGASDGRWSEVCMKHYPYAFYYLIEAQQPHQESLEVFKKRHKHSNYIIAAAGSSIGEIYFDNSDLFGGLASDISIGANCIKVPLTTIDTEVEKYLLGASFLIKLDTHGYEVPILEGAKETLKKTNLVIIETYNFQIAKDSLRFWEMCAYMEKLGFLPIDMVDFIYRKKDNIFWQMDIFFIKKEREEFNHHDYE